MELLLHTFVTLFVVLDPVGIAPMFVALVHSDDEVYQKKMAIRSTLIASGILLIFFFIGDALLKLLGIGLPAFRIAGGALLFLLSIDMIFARHSGLRSTTIREQQEAERRDDISVFPLAFPLIAGPGALTTVLLASTSLETPSIIVGMLAILFIVLLITLISLLYSVKITRLLGETGTNVISRLFGLILAALAAQYIVDGIRAAFLT
jgi:multiple antibiotic resistance protein